MLWCPMEIVGGN
uniref:Uncharacterized protein n=1 Tax=Arundo donax TaxID=35708 RepID=A0A0A9AWD0_ARUDO